MRSECFRSSSAQRTQGEDTAEQGMSKTPTGQDGVQAQRVLQVFIHKEGLGHGGGVRQPGGLNQNVVKPAAMSTRGWSKGWVTASSLQVREGAGSASPVVSIRMWSNVNGMEGQAWPSSAGRRFQ